MISLDDVKSRSEVFDPNAMTPIGTFNTLCVYCVRGDHNSLSCKKGKRECCSCSKFESKPMYRIQCTCGKLLQGEILLNAQFVLCADCGEVQDIT